MRSVTSPQCPSFLRIERQIRLLEFDVNPVGRELLAAPSAGEEAALVVVRLNLDEPCAGDRKRGEEHWCSALGRGAAAQFRSVGLLAGGRRWVSCRQRKVRLDLYQGRLPGGYPTLGGQIPFRDPVECFGDVQCAAPAEALLRLAAVEPQGQLLVRRRIGGRAPRRHDVPVCGEQFGDVGDGIYIVTGWSEVPLPEPESGAAASVCARTR